MRAISKKVRFFISIYIFIPKKKLKVDISRTFDWMIKMGLFSKWRAFNFQHFFEKAEMAHIQFLARIWTSISNICCHLPFFCGDERMCILKTPDPSALRHYKLKILGAQRITKKGVFCGDERMCILNTPDPSALRHYKLKILGTHGTKKCEMRKQRSINLTYRAK